EEDVPCTTPALPEWVNVASSAELEKLPVPTLTLSNVSVARPSEFVFCPAGSVLGETGLTTITPCVGGLVSATIDAGSLVPLIVMVSVPGTDPPCASVTSKDTV